MKVGFFQNFISVSYGKSTKAVIMELILRHIFVVQVRRIVLNVNCDTFRLGSVYSLHLIMQLSS